jgi:predicted RNA-binding Zn ribbon-like protein
MLFTHDTELVLTGMAALVNTMPGTLPGEAQEEELRTVADLSDFYDRWQYTGRHDRTLAELEAVRGIRPRLRLMWELDEPALVDHVNGLLREGSATPQLVDHDGIGWHIHATDRDAPLATRILVECAMAVVDVLRADELARLQQCARPDCDDVFVDLSRNRSKRFCDTVCGNRQAAADYRARQAAT